MTGYTPATEGAAYRWRSPAYFASGALTDLSPPGSDIPFLMFQGYADPEIKFHQACELASDMSASVYYVGSDGNVPCTGSIAEPSEATLQCVGSPITAPCPYISSVSQSGRSLVVYEGANHATILVSAYLEFAHWVTGLNYEAKRSGVDLFIVPAGPIVLAPDSR